MEYEEENSSVAFLYKAMRNRAPNKRQVKPVQKHLIQTNFGGDDSENDSDYQVEIDDISDEEHIESKSLNDKPSGESESGSPENTDESDESESENESQSESNSSDEEEEIAVRKGGNLFDGIDSDDDDDEDYVPGKKQKQGKKKQPAEKQRIKSPEITQAAVEMATLNNTRAMKVLICCVCLGDISEDDDEIVECDNCGVAVHEGCYGISDNQSIASTESSASTEPWYCDACKAGVKPDCELCPNEGGIFKETDAGKWVHLVCALYTPGVAFGDVDKLSPVTLFEMPYSRWGLKECSLCEDLRFSRTGVCISCDAGLCRSYFHVTCAQREGLLSEASPEEVMDIADPFFAYCKLHADKNATKAKRRHWLAIQSHVRQHAQTDIEDEKEKTRFERKLNRHRQKYELAKAKRPSAWVPTQKMVRYLTSSPSAVKKMLRKAELMGIITQSTHVSHHTEKQELRKKSHIPPAFSTDFITHYLDRNMRIENMRASLKDLMAQNQKLREQEKVLRSQYDTLLNGSEKIKDPAHRMRKEGEKIFSMLAEIIGKPIPLPEILRPKKVHKSPVRREIPKSPPPTVINKCGICCKTHDQHLLAKCDSCKLSYHLGCLDPPLTRMPKKTSNYGWQCSECTPSSSDESVEGSSVNVNAPRRLREKIKEPVKFSKVQQDMEAFPLRRGKKNTKQRQKTRRREKTKDSAKASKEVSPVDELKHVKDGCPIATTKNTREESPISIDDDEIVLSDSNSMDVDVKIIEETTPVKLPPVNQDVSRTGRRRIKKKRYSTDSDEVAQKQKSKKRSLSESPGELPSTSTPKMKKELGTECIKCGRPGDRTNMVSCDECEMCYHFSCLDPPFKKTPKQRGYSWYCEACDDASEDSENGNDT